MSQPLCKMGLCILSPRKPLLNVCNVTDVVDVTETEWASHMDPKKGLTVWGERVVMIMVKLKCSKIAYNMRCVGKLCLKRWTGSKRWRAWILNCGVKLFLYSVEPSNGFQTQMYKFRKINLFVTLEWVGGCRRDPIANSWKTLNWRGNEVRSRWW